MKQYFLEVWLNSNKTQASGTSTCVHFNTSFCESHTRLSQSWPWWLQSQCNIMAVFFQYPSLWDRRDHSFNSEGLSEFLDIKWPINIYCWTPQWLCYVRRVTFRIGNIINTYGWRDWLIIGKIGSGFFCGWGSLDYSLIIRNIMKIITFYHVVWDNWGLIKPPIIIQSRRAGGHAENKVLF